MPTLPEAELNSQRRNALVSPAKVLLILAIRHTSIGVFPRPNSQNMIFNVSCNCRSSFVLPVIVPNAPLVGVEFGPLQFG